MPVLVVLCPSAAAASPGDRDNAFGEGGFTTTAIGSTTEPVLRDMIRLDDGRLLVAGGSKVGEPGILARYLSDGSLDPAFGDGDGIALTPDSLWAGVDVQSSGKIIAFGRSGAEAAVARFTADGQLDPGFGVGGVLELESRSLFRDMPTYIETTGPGVDSDDRIVASIGLGGCSVDGSGGETAVGQNLCGNIGLYRFDADGVPDASFGGGDGLRIVAAGPTHNLIEMAPDDTLTIAGSYGYEEEGRDGYIQYGWSWVKRLQADGSPMTEFGSGGWVVPEEFDDQPPRFVLTEDGGRVTVALSSIATRYLPDGSLDTSFGEDGRTTIAAQRYNSGSPDRASDAAYDPQGRLFVAGGGIISGKSTLGVIRFDPEGEIDPTFSNDGAAWFPAGSGFTQTQIDSRRGLFDASIGLDDQGRPVVAGTGSRESMLDFRIGRFMTGDEVRLSCEGEPATVQFTGGDVVTTAGRVTVTGAGDDVITNIGFAGAGSLVCSGAGNDLLKGGVTSDRGARVFSGPGADRVKLRRAPAEVDTGPGRDEVELSGAALGPVNTGGGDDLVEMISGTADVFGGPGNDRIFGSERRLNGGTDRFFGGPGNDLLNGESGTDLLKGGSGGDLLIGGKNDDRLFGQGGSDRLFGGSGLDFLSGGPGRDLAEDSLLGPPRRLYGSGGSGPALTVEFQKQKVIRGSVTMPFRCGDGRTRIRTSETLLKAVDYDAKTGKLRWNNTGNLTYFGWENRSRLRGRVAAGSVRIAVIATGYVFDDGESRIPCWSGKGTKGKWLKFEAVRRPNPKQIVRP